MSTIRPATEADVDRIVALATQAFNLPTSSHDRIAKELKVERVRVAEVDGVVKATARYIPFGHFYGGRPLRSAGIAGVVVTPDMRGKGLGSRLVGSLLDELRADGYPLSSLYPATAPIYASLGYGFGSIRTNWRVRLSELPASRPAGDVDEFGAEALDELHDAYSAFAATQNGLLDRTREWWETRVLRDWNGNDHYRYLVREQGRVTGWIMYRLTESKDSWKHTVECRDFIWTTPQACRALLALASLHRSTAEWVTWVGPPSDPVRDVLPEDILELTSEFRTMLRLLDVPAAIEGRGYNPVVTASVTIAVTDPSFEQNNGTWRVEVAGGEAKCLPAEGAQASATVQTWAQLWASLTSPREALRTGALDASPAAVDALEAIFTGPTPWIGDFF